MLTAEISNRQRGGGPITDLVNRSPGQIAEQRFRDHAGVRDPLDRRGQWTAESYDPVPAWRFLDLRKTTHARQQPLRSFHPRAHIAFCRRVAGCNTMSDFPEYPGKIRRRQLFLHQTKELAQQFAICFGKKLLALGGQLVCIGRFTAGSPAFTLPDKPSRSSARR